MNLSFASPWVDPRELFFVTNKNHSNPLGKEHKINDKYPLPRGKYEHPQYNIEVWHPDEVKAAKNLGLEGYIYCRPKLEQTAWERPYGPAKPFPKLNKFIPCWEKRNTKSATPPGFSGGRPTGKQMISA